jgi:chromosome partitioning protein
MHVLTLGGSKGGISKTSLAACLCVEAAKTMKVGFYDADPQKSLTRWHDLAQGGKDHIALVEARTPAAAVAVAHSRGLDLLVVDTPPALVKIIEACISVAELVLIPSKPSPIDIEAVDVSVNLSQKAGKPFVFVLSMVPVQGGEGLKLGAKQSLSEHGTVLPTLVFQRIPYMAAMVNGRTGPEIDAKAAAEIKALWAELRKRMGITAKR